MRISSSNLRLWQIMHRLRSVRKDQKAEGDAVDPACPYKGYFSGIGRKKREDQFICGFAMETEHLLENAKAKREKKKVDMIVANSIRQSGAGFGGDTNVATFDHRRGHAIPAPDEQGSAGYGDFGRSSPRSSFTIARISLVK